MKNTKFCNDLTFPVLQYADDKSNTAQLVETARDFVENIAGKGEYPGYLHTCILIFQRCFLKTSS